MHNLSGKLAMANEANIESHIKVILKKIIIDYAILTYLSNLKNNNENE